MVVEQVILQEWENVPKYIPVKAIYERLPSALIKHLISFH